MYPIKLGNTPSDAAIAFRANSNALPFMNNLYNAEHVLTSTPKNKQIIFMDAQYNAEFDVNVLASAFNMEKTDFMGRLMLIDSFSTFDNDRFSIIVDNSEQMELVTQDELNLMKDVKAILIDSDWFQVYDNQNRMTETYVSSGLYWNYFYHVWKTVSYSPFANALVFVGNTATITAPETLEFVIIEISTDNRVTVLTFEPKDTKTLSHMNYQFVQTKSDAQAGIAVHKYGAVIVPSSKVKIYTPTVVLDGVQYQADPIIDVTKCTAGQEITCNKNA